MFSKRGNSKAQSAMEYLMTYGWAILIISIVLAALFALGVFSSSSFVGTTCIAASGYECATPLLHSGLFTATIGQATGTSWATTNVVFISGGGVPSSLANTVFTGSVCAQTVSGGLTSGASFTFTVNTMASGTGALSCTGGTFLSTIGSSYTGSLWAEYTSSGVSGYQWSQIATVTLKAT